MWLSVLRKLANCLCPFSFTFYPQKPPEHSDLIAQEVAVGLSTPRISQRVCHSLSINAFITCCQSSEPMLSCDYCVEDLLKSLSLPPPRPTTRVEAVSHVPYLFPRDVIAIA
ncbi:hypothetical protein J6590_071517 [Homalodisca vitripennis]|nr:hypothetical protein J6590_071517 [Homalodisca vitripennis]